MITKIFLVVCCLLCLLGIYVTEVHGCPPGQPFTCGNGECIRANYVCDSYDDCGDKSDEINCYGCLPGLFSCGNPPAQPVCIPPEQVCDGVLDCPLDGRDEHNCPQHAIDNADSSVMGSKYFDVILVGFSILSILILSAICYVIHSRKKRQSGIQRQTNIETRIQVQNNRLGTQNQFNQEIQLSNITPAGIQSAYPNINGYSNYLNHQSSGPNHSCHGDHNPIQSNGLSVVELQMQASVRHLEPPPYESAVTNAPPNHTGAEQGTLETQEVFCPPSYESLYENSRL